MLIVPAIDLRAGRVVRLQQGDYARETAYPVEPLVLAHEYAAHGAAWLHVVDLDGARRGAQGNLRAIAAIATGVLQVQAGGGVRSETDVQRLFDIGVARVVVGSLAVREPERVETWIARFGVERICIALDTREHGGVWQLPVEGWTQSHTATLRELAPRYAAYGARHILCTDIDRDGTLAGPNLELYWQLREWIPDIALQASGGVRDVNDLRELKALGVSAAIIGRGLLEGRLTFSEAAAC